MSEEQTGELVHVLMAEDSPTDAELAQLALQEAKVRIDLKVVEDGIETLAYLRKEGQYQNAKTPDVILLDLNMPRMDGREALLEIRKDPALKKIPVVILTTSDAQEDVDRAYESAVNAFVTKP